MSDQRKGKLHHPYREGGRVDPNSGDEPLPERAQNRSRGRKQKGHGGEGFSKGYGGSAGSGASEPSGPEKSDKKSAGAEAEVTRTPPRRSR